MAFLNFFFGPKKSSCCTKNPIIDPIFLLDYYFSVLEETKSPLNGFLSTQIKKLWVKSFPMRELNRGNRVSVKGIVNRGDLNRVN